MPLKPFKAHIYMGGIWDISLFMNCTALHFCYPHGHGSCRCTISGILLQSMLYIAIVVHC